MHWTFTAFWTDPWTKSDIIAAWSAAISVSAILAALALAVWEHRRASRADARRRRDFIDAAVAVLDEAISQAQAFEDACLSQSDQAAAIGILSNITLERAKSSLSALRPVAPPDGPLALALTGAVEALVPTALAYSRGPDDGSMRESITMTLALLQVAKAQISARRSR